jgi:hypothetical protein
MSPAVTAAQRLDQLADRRPAIGKLQSDQIATPTISREIENSAG